MAIVSRDIPKHISKVFEDRQTRRTLGCGRVRYQPNSKQQKVKSEKLKPAQDSFVELRRKK